MRRPPLGRARNPRQRIFGAPDLPERDRELRLDRGVLSRARGFLERGDRLRRTALQQQGAAEEMQRRRMLRDPSQYVAREALGVLATALVYGGRRPLQRCLCLPGGSARRAPGGPLVCFSPPPPCC